MKAKKKKGVKASKEIAIRPPPGLEAFGPPVPLDLSPAWIAPPEWMVPTPEWTLQFPIMGPPGLSFPKGTTQCALGPVLLGRLTATQRSMTSQSLVAPPASCCDADAEPCETAEIASSLSSPCGRRPRSDTMDTPSTAAPMTRVASLASLMCTSPASADFDV